MRKHTFHVLLFAAALVAVLALAPTAEACYDKLVYEPSSGCIVCGVSETYTGATCEEPYLGSCGGAYLIDCTTLNSADEPQVLCAEAVMTPANPPQEVQPQATKAPIPVVD